MLWEVLGAVVLSAAAAVQANQLPLNGQAVHPANMPRRPMDGFSVRDGKDVFSPRVMLEMPRPHAGVANFAGDLAYVPVTQYSFENRTTTKTVYLFSLDFHLPAATITGLGVFWIDSRSLIRVIEDDGVQILEVLEVTVNKNSLNVSPPKNIGALPKSASADNFLYSQEAGILSFSAAVYDDYDLHTVNSQDEVHATRGTSAYVFDETFVRHWDTWRGPKKNRLFSVSLTKSDGTWNLGDNFHRPLLHTTHYTPVEPFGDTGDLSVSSTHIAYTTKDLSVPEALHTRQNVYIVPLNGGEEPKHLTTGKQGATHSPAISRDGKKVVWLELALDGYESDRAQIVVYDLKKDIRFKVAASWDRSPSEVSFSHDDSRLIVIAGDFGHDKVFFVDLPATPSGASTKEVYAVLEVEESIPYVLTGQHTASLAQSLPNGRLLFTQNSLTTPNNLWLLSGLDTPDEPLKLKQISHFAETQLQGLSLSSAEEFWFEGAKGVQVHGFALKPKGWEEGKKKAYPAVLLIHGGPQGAWEDAWSNRWNPNIFAHQGYFTILINPSGSTTYGQAFTDSITEDWGGRPFVDLKLGWKFALQTYPEIDPERTVAAGASWGGYAINWINGHDEEYGFGFKALVCHDGVFDTTYNGLSTDELFFFNHDFGGPPWKAKTAEKFNPSKFVGQWKTPQLLIHGGKDYRLPETESIGAFHALQQRGIPSRFLYFPDENHWVLNPENSLKWHHEVFKWFAEFLGEKWDLVN